MRLHRRTLDADRALRRTRRRRLGWSSSSLFPTNAHPFAPIVSKATGHRLVVALRMLQPDQVTDSLRAYQLAKRGNSLRVKAESVRWAKRDARVNAISPGIIITPLANDELNGPRGEGYRRMIELSPVGRAGTPDEVGAVGALLMGAEGAFITGSDILMDGGVTASYFYGDLSPANQLSSQPTKDPHAS